MSIQFSEKIHRFLTHPQVGIHTTEHRIVTGASLIAIIFTYIPLFTFASPVDDMTTAIRMMSDRGIFSSTEMDTAPDGRISIEQMRKLLKEMRSSLVVSCSQKSYSSLEGCVGLPSLTQSSNSTTRIETLRSLFDSIGISPLSGASGYRDVDGGKVMPYNLVGYVTRARSIGCISPSDYFRPYDIVTKSELIKISSCALSYIIPDDSDSDHSWINTFSKKTSKSPVIGIPKEILNTPLNNNNNPNTQSSSNGITTPLIANPYGAPYATVNYTPLNYYNGYLPESSPDWNVSRDLFVGRNAIIKGTISSNGITNSGVLTQNGDAHFDGNIEVSGTITASGLSVSHTISSTGNTLISNIGGSIGTGNIINSHSLSISGTILSAESNGVVAQTDISGAIEYSMSGIVEDLSGRTTNNTLDIASLSGVVSHKIGYADLSATGTIVYDTITGRISWSGTTDDIVEGVNNLYYTTARFISDFTTRFQTAFDTALSMTSTDDISEGSGNLYFTDIRAQNALSGTITGIQTDITTANQNIADMGDRTSLLESMTHAVATLGTSNGLSLSGQEISLDLASSATVGALSASDWNTFNNKENILTFSNGLTRSGDSVGIGTLTGGMMKGFTNGGITFGTPSGGLSQSTNLIWDTTNNRLGIGVASPVARLDILPANTAADVGLQIKQSLTTGTTFQTLMKLLDKNNNTILSVDSRGSDGATRISSMGAWSTLATADILGYRYLTSGSAAQGVQAKNMVISGTYSTDISALSASTLYGNTTAGGNFTVESTTSTTKGNILLNPSGGNVGIGTVLPTHKLDVVGGHIHLDNNRSILIRNSSNASDITLVTVDGTNTAKFANGAIQANAGGGSSTLYVGSNNGNVGIGTSSPTYKLEVSGDINAIGTVRANGIALSSDSRFKENVISIANSTDIISRLLPVSYTWNALGVAHGGKVGTTEYGFIAQDVESVLPFAVNTAIDGYKSLNYIDFIPHLVGAVKDLIQKDAMMSGAIIDISHRIDSLSQSTTNTVINNYYTSGSLSSSGSSWIDTVFSYTSGLMIQVESTFSESVTFMKSVVFNSAVIFNERLTFADKDMAGTATIRAGESSVRIDFDRPYAELPRVTASADAFVMYRITSKSVTGFTIEIQGSAATDISFDWIAIMVRGAGTTMSNIVVPPPVSGDTVSNTPSSGTPDTESAPVDTPVTNTGSDVLPSEIPDTEPTPVDVPVADSGSIVGPTVSGE